MAELPPQDLRTLSELSPMGLLAELRKRHPRIEDEDTREPSSPLEAEWMSDETDKFPIVGSSNVKTVGYNRTFRRLFIEFLNGSLYAYDKVPWTTFSQLMSNDSKGAAVYDYVRGAFGKRKLPRGSVDTQFACRRVR